MTGKVAGTFCVHKSRVEVEGFNHHPRVQGVVANTQDKFTLTKHMGTHTSMKKKKQNSKKSSQEADEKLKCGNELQIDCLLSIYSRLVQHGAGGPHLA